MSDEAVKIICGTALAIVFILAMLTDFFDKDDKDDK